FGSVWRPTCNQAMAWFLMPATRKKKKRVDAFIKSSEARPLKILVPVLENDLTRPHRVNELFCCGSATATLISAAFTSVINCGKQAIPSWKKNYGARLKVSSPNSTGRFRWTCMVQQDSP